MRRRAGKGMDSRGQAGDDLRDGQGPPRFVSGPIAAAQHAGQVCGVTVDDAHAFKALAQVLRQAGRMLNDNQAAGGQPAGAQSGGDGARAAAQLDDDGRGVRMRVNVRSHAGGQSAGAGADGPHGAGPSHQFAPQQGVLLLLSAENGCQVFHQGKYGWREFAGSGELHHKSPELTLPRALRAKEENARANSFTLCRMGAPSRWHKGSCFAS